MNYPIENHIIHFLARKESPKDVRKLKKWLSVDPDRRDELKKWLAVWDMIGMMGTVEKFSPDKAYRCFILQM